MDVLDLQVLCDEGLHLNEAPFGGLLFRHCVCGRLLLAAET